MFWFCMSPRPKGERDVLVLYVRQTKRRKGCFGFVCPPDQKEEGMFWFCMSPRPKGERDVLVLYVPQD